MADIQHPRRIAFDLDGTLVDGASSKALADFILHHPDIAYFIVTFRTPDQCATVDSELADMGLRLALFARLVPMPRTIAFEFDEDQRHRRVAGLPPMRSGVNLLPGETRFVHWKGFVCSKLGARLLVDDMPDLSRPGCEQHHIELLEPSAFTGRFVRPSHADDPLSVLV